MEDCHRGLQDLADIVRGESKNIEVKLTNGSDTDSAYVFLELQKNDAWSLSTSWEKVEGTDIYA